jgi:hypothetical protein
MFLHFSQGVQMHTPPPGQQYTHITCNTHAEQNFSLNTQVSPAQYYMFLHDVSCLAQVSSRRTSHH